MQLVAAFAILIDLRLAIQAALPETVKAVWRSPSLLLQPVVLSRVFMAHVWTLFGNGVDEGGRDVKQQLIPTNAYGLVLDLGAGHGHTASYLDRSKVTKYIALEPNTMMHKELRTRANAAGFSESDGSLLVLSCNAEDIDSIISFVGGELLVDTFISILSLCTIPHPEEALTVLIRKVLKHDGQFLFYEHVLSPRKDVAWWQRFWTPIWRLAFDGCRLDRPSHLMVDGIKVSEDKADAPSIWKEGNYWGKEGEPEEHLFWHQAGRYVKA